MRGAIFALPFSQLNVSVSRLPKGYTRKPNSIAEHLMKLRFDLKLTQKAVAEQIGVTQAMVCNWERGFCEPGIGHMKNVIDFIGYYPSGEPTTLGERIKKYRFIHGLSLAEFGALVDACEATVWFWENGKNEPMFATRNRIENLVGE